MEDLIGQELAVGDAVAFRVSGNYQHATQLLAGRIRKINRRYVHVDYTYSKQSLTRRIDPRRDLVKISDLYYVNYQLSHQG